MIRGLNLWDIYSRTPWQPREFLLYLLTLKAHGRMEKQKELEAPSNYSCGIWTKNVISKAGKSLKVHARNVAMPGTDIVTDLVTQLTNEFLDRR